MKWWLSSGSWEDEAQDPSLPLERDQRWVQSSHSRSVQGNQCSKQCGGPLQRIPKEAARAQKKTGRQIAQVIASSFGTLGFLHITCSMKGFHWILPPSPSSKSFHQNLPPDPSTRPSLFLFLFPLQRTRPGQALQRGKKEKRKRKF